MRLLTAIFFLCCGVSSGTDRPNVVLILADDMDERLDCQTPNLDRLAQRSAVITRGIAHVPLCRPSLATILSGRYPWETGIESNDNCGPLSATNSLATVLSAAGYATRCEGKFWEPIPSAPNPSQYGFASVGDVGRNPDLFVNGQRELREWIHQQAAGGTPFFAWVGPYLPHTSFQPHDVPQRYLDLYAGQPQQNLKAYTTWLDDGVGELIGTLSDVGVLHNTLVIFVNDNGWSEDGKPSKGTWFARGNECRSYWYWQGRISSKTLPGQYSFADIYPTILDYCDVAIPTTASGQSLRTAIATSEGGDDPQFGLANSASYPVRVARWMSEGNFKYAFTMQPSTSAEYWQHPPTFAAGQHFLYDRATDPHEEANVADDPAHAATVAAMSAAAQAWYESLGMEPAQADAGIIDDSQAGFSVVAGNWGSGPLGYLGTNRYASGGSGANKIRWTIPTETGKTYTIAATWAESPSRATNSPFKVINGADQQTFLVNQEQAPNDFTDAGAGWKTLGQFTAQGTTILIELTDAANEYVIADAVRFEEVAP